ncbi:hypothetical protein ISN45_Aa03g000820 [Arabidopsis thaliana x Arabidopsis arenosa]|uniref:Prolamin-like domain-containing protein n=1 Tax=Arabidopsis thaliana x Arabidopsis arenosa TaxID=1240361 RepID=A0A8T2AN94_9BRAS|nr:hypothetical protein ISN45_Aa03g000820 [Arabidopsis thaliana x Arabidopsis arenosa]
MKLKQTKVMFFLSALILALIVRPSEAAPRDVYCLTTRISRVPGCYDALRLAAGRDYRWLSVDCCRAVFATLPETCVLTLKALISTLMFQPSGAKDTPLCPTAAIDNQPGCFDALRLAAGDADFRWLNIDCCKAVRTLPDYCYLLVYPGRAFPINIFKSICNGKFPPLRH